MENPEKKAGSKKRTGPPEFEPLERDFPSSIVAGVDEAGRGALAGPVAVGLVVLPRRFYHDAAELSGVNDSKLLNYSERERYYSLIKEHAIYAGAALISGKTIDRIGLNPATYLGIFRLIKHHPAYGSAPFSILVDGNYSFKTHPLKNCAFQSIIKGDSRILSIACASVIAKVSRDRRMVKYAGLFPKYSFERHKGYGTEEHRKIIAEIGRCHLHRKSFQLVDSQLEFQFGKD